jgi:SAM-dependent methyltransferase
MQATSYVGGELELFAQAEHWKRYIRDLVQPFIGDEVLEIGAGMGGTTEFVSSDRSRKWVCLEPDPQLASIIDTKIHSRLLPQCCSTRVGTIHDVPLDEVFDSVLYIDVLEHIADDRREVMEAARRLKTGGYLVVLSPAHQWLFSPFDRAIGHHRRYTARSLISLTPELLSRERFWYLDSVGLFASLANRTLLQQGMPTLRQIRFWDNTLVPISRVSDRLLSYSFGKSILGIWCRK